MEQNDAVFGSNGDAYRLAYGIKIPARSQELIQFKNGLNFRAEDE